MKSALNDITQYMLRHSENKKILIENIRQFGLERIMKDTIREIDTVEYNKVNDLLMVQKVKNVLFLEELKKLTYLFNENGIKFINIKGIFFAADVYNPIEVRKVRDLDILVDQDDIQSAFEIFIKMEYKLYPTGVPLSREILDINLNSTLRQGIHLPIIYTEKYLGPHKIRIYVDLHTNIFHRIQDKEFVIKEIINRSVKETLCGQKVWIMELHDRLIHLLCHFTKEYFKVNVVELFTHGRKVYPSLNHIHDIALLIDKNEKIINWETVLERIKNMQRYGDTLFPFQLLNGLYPNRVPKQLIAQLQEKVASNNIDFMGQALPIITTFDPQVIIYEDPCKVMNNILSKLKFRGPNLQCPFISDRNTTQCFNSSFEIDEYNVNKNNIFGTYLRAGQMPLSSNDCSAKGDVWWDSINFYINVRVYDMLNISKNPATIDLTIGIDKEYNDSKFEYFTSLVSFIPVLEMEKAKLLFKIVNTLQSIHEPEEYKNTYELELYDDGYNIFIAIPWTVINIDPFIGKEIWFDINLIYYNDRYNTQRTLLAWSNTENGYDPVLLGKLVLSKGV